MKQLKSALFSELDDSDSAGSDYIPEVVDPAPDPWEDDARLKRRSFSRDQKNRFRDLYSRLDNDLYEAVELFAAQEEIQIHPEQARKWLTPNERKKPGPKYDASFERELVEDLTMDLLYKLSSSEAERRAKFNGLRSYGFIRQAARSFRDVYLRRSPQPSKEREASLAKCKFSDKWVGGFLKRNNLSRLRVIRLLTAGW